MGSCVICFCDEHRQKAMRDNNDTVTIPREIWTMVQLIIFYFMFYTQEVGVEQFTSLI